MNPGLDTKKKILDATLSLILEFGIEHITVRQIATKAGVNISAINYHFASKEVAMNEALLILVTEFEACFEVFSDQRMSPKDRLIKFYMDYHKVSLKYPDLLKNLITTKTQNYPLEFSRFIRDKGIQMIRSCISEIIVISDEEAMFIRFFQSMSAIAFPIILGRIAVDQYGLNYLNEEVMKKYISIVVENLINS